MKNRFNVGISEEAEQRFNLIHLTLHNRYKQFISRGEAFELMIGMLHDSLEDSYREMDYDEEIKKQTIVLEKMILGERGIGMLDALGLTPSKIQKHLDTWIEEGDDENKN